MSTTRRDFLISAAGTMGAMAIVPELALGSPRPASAGPLKIGLIGCGRQGRSMLTELAKMENIQITGLCDVDETRANSAARRTQGAEAFTSHKAMLEKLKDLDAVIVATPTHLHKDPTVDALSAGKHVYCEMPLAHTAEDARAIASAALAAKTLCAVGLEGRSNPVYKLARTFYRSDAVREAISIEAQNHQKTTWRFPAADRNRENEVNWRLDPAVSTGLAGELGVHQFDVGTWYCDKLPTSVRGFGSIRLHADGREIADTILLELAYADGLRMSYSASLCNSYLGKYELFRGSNAAIRLAWTHGWMFKEADAPTQGWEVYANRQQFHNDEGITLIADATKLAEQGKLKEGVGLPNPSVYYPLWDFVHSVTENKPAVADARAGYAATIIGLMANQAVKTGGEVKIDPGALKV
jgi:predicted dehydrogenase